MRGFISFYLIFVSVVGVEQVWGRNEREQLKAYVKEHAPPKGEGNEQAKGRIIDGDPASPGEYPWMLSLYYKGQFLCGASIFDPRTVIAVAHCVVHDPEQKNGRFVIKAGDHKLFVKDDTEQKVVVDDIIVHPKFRYDSYGYDIAVLILEERLEMNDYVKRIMIPAPWKEKLLLERNQCVFSGWGWTDYDSQTFPWLLQDVEAPIMPRAACRKYLKAGGVDLSEKQVCTFNPDNKGGCVHDSGAPLVCFDKNDDAYQVGSIEFGDDACSSGFAVFTRLSKYRTWIAGVID